MQPPVKPTLQEFGLSEDDRAALPRVGKISLVIVIVVTAYLILRFAAAVYDSKHPFTSVLLMLFVGFFLLGFWAFAGALVYYMGVFVEKRILSAWNPKYAAFLKYEQATAAYGVLKKEHDAEMTRRKEAFWRSLSGTDFENELGRLYSQLGYEVRGTPRTGDGGVDLILRKEGRTTVVQCKAHAKKIPIGVARELCASMADFGADEAIIACLEGVTQPVSEYIRNKPIKVVSVQDIVRMQTSLGR